MKRAGRQHPLQLHRPETLSVRLDFAAANEYPAARWITCPSGREALSRTGQPFTGNAGYSDAREWLIRNRPNS
jgi:hypothetical protein